MTTKESSFIENFGDQELRIMDLTSQNLGNRSELEQVIQNLNSRQIIYQISQLRGPKARMTTWLS